MKLKRLVVGEELTNCYVVQEDGHAIVIDPGDEGKRIKRFLQKQELELDMILLTHGHGDHSAAVDYLYDSYSVPIYLHEGDREYALNASLEGSYVIKAPYKAFPNNLQWFSHSIKIQNLNGHSEGSVLIQIEEYYFSGDILFVDGIGRYDIVGADREELYSSLRYLLSLEKNTRLYPGHDESFTIQEAIERNSYLNKLW